MLRTENTWQFKVIALTCTLLLSVGSHYSAHVLGSLKSTLKKELHITNAQYGVLQSSVSVVNTVIPLIGGLFIDRFGTTSGSLISSSMILLGNILVALSTHWISFEAMLLGRVIYGVGSGCIVLVQQTILSHWFKGHGLAMVIGAMISTGKLASFLASATAIPIKESTGFYGYALWVCAIFCFFSWCINIFYVIKVSKLHDDSLEQERRDLVRKKRFNFKEPLYFSSLFWLIIYCSLTFSSFWAPFLHVNMELIKNKFGSSDLISSWVASIPFLIPILLSMFGGAIIDYSSHRLLIVVICALLSLLSFYLLSFTMASPIFSMLLFSLSLTIGPVALVSSIPLTIPRYAIGTGMGMYKTASNIGSTIMDILVGKLQDDSSGLYDTAIIAFIVASLLALAFSIALWAVDWRVFSGSLNKGNSALEVLSSPEVNHHSDPNNGEETPLLDSQNEQNAPSMEVPPSIPPSTSSTVVTRRHQCECEASGFSTCSTTGFTSANCSKEVLSKRGKPCPVVPNFIPTTAPKTNVEDSSEAPCPHNNEFLPNSCRCRNFGEEVERSTKPYLFAMISLGLMGVVLVISWLSFFHFLDKK